MGSNTIEWRLGHNVCRCCLNEGCDKDISAEYVWMGKKEVYQEMLSDTFNLKISITKSGCNNSHLICDPCILKLRNASEFKRQVQESELTLFQYQNPGISINKAHFMEVEVDASIVEGVKQEIQCDVNSANEPFDDSDGRQSERFLPSDGETDSTDKNSFSNYTPVFFAQAQLDNIDKESTEESVKFKFGMSGTMNKKHKVKKKPHICDVCNKSFRWLSDLHRHSLTHTGEKPFPCDVCGKAFTVKSNLKIHKNIHTNTKPYICDICQKGFKQLCDVQRHRLIHTGEKPFSCDDCGKSFKRRDCLNIHKNIHNNIKPYGCDICEKSFYRLSHLRQHRSTHTGGKPYTCDVCGRSFKWKQSINRHIISGCENNFDQK